MSGSEYSSKKFSTILDERINKLEENIINIQKAINNLQYHFSTQTTQTSLIKTFNKKFAS
jgi:hypothetical protein